MVLRRRLLRHTILETVVRLGVEPASTVLETHQARWGVATSHFLMGGQEGEATSTPQASTISCTLSPDNLQHSTLPPFYLGVLKTAFYFDAVPATSTCEA